MTSSFILIGIVSLFASFLTFFSGFGLGTLLLPVFAIFFAVEEAITLTAIVHFCNNIFKTAITYKDLDYNVVKSFGLTSIIGAIIGSFIFVQLASSILTFNYEIISFYFETSILKIMIGLLILIFTIIEFINFGKWIKPNRKTLLLGGLISGFFGGISGHQGALRTLFLSKLNLDKFQFISSGILIALLVDVSRIPVYFTNLNLAGLTNGIESSIIAILSALLGAVIGKTYLKKIKINSLYKIVSICLILFSIVFAVGII